MQGQQLIFSQLPCRQSLGKETLYDLKAKSLVPGPQIGRREESQQVKNNRHDSRKYSHATYSELGAVPHALYILVNLTLTVGP